ncbi:MAG: hypothetical protein LBE83_07880 [Propionibacteriaceae bacterium]|nr:hypothetical protein [Propionibacteriaceae bacterium]
MGKLARFGAVAGVVITLSVGALLLTAQAGSELDDRLAFSGGGGRRRDCRAEVVARRDPSDLIAALTSLRKRRSRA